MVMLWEFNFIAQMCATRSYRHRVKRTGLNDWFIAYHDEQSVRGISLLLRHHRTSYFASREEAIANLEGHVRRRSFETKPESQQCCTCLVRTSNWRVGTAW